MLYFEKMTRKKKKYQSNNSALIGSHKTVHTYSTGLCAREKERERLRKRKSR